MNQIVGGSSNHQMKLLGRSWDPNCPTVVAEVPLQFAFDGATGKRGERNAISRIESIDSLDEPEHCHLTKILLGAPWPAEALGDVRGKPHVPLDEPIAKRPRTPRRKLDEQIEIVAIVEGAAGGVLRHRCSDRLASTIGVTLSRREKCSQKWFCDPLVFGVTAARE